MRSADALPVAPLARAELPGQVNDVDVINLTTQICDQVCVMTNAEIFSRAKVPDIKNLRGEFAVRLVVPLLPAIRFFGHTKVAPEHIREKAGGYNRFLSSLKLGNFRLETGLSAFGDKLEVLKIIYDHPQNPFWLRLLTDELRELDNGNYFCRGIYNVFGTPLNIMYFSMDRL